MWLHDLTSDHGFRVAICISVILVSLTAAAALALRAGRTTAPLPLSALAVVAATLVGLPGFDAGGPLPLGLLLLAVGGFAVINRPRWFAGAVALPGALVVGTAVPDVAPRWAPWFVVAVIVLATPLAAIFDDRTGWVGIGTVLIPITALGIYATVPDTEEATTLVGAAIPVALLGFPVSLAALGRTLSAPMVGLLAWIAATGGRGRPGAIVGATACMGVLLLGPFVRDLGRGVRSLPQRVPALAGIGGVHVGFVAVVARIAGLRVSAIEAAVIVTLALLVAALLLVAADRVIPVRQT